MELPTSHDELNRAIGRLEGICEGYVGRLDILSEKMDDLAKELRHHNKQVHGNFDWRVIGGLLSGGSLVAGAIGAFIIKLVERPGG